MGDHEQFSSDNLYGSVEGDDDGSTFADCSFDSAEGEGWSTVEGRSSGNDTRCCCCC